MTRNPKGRNPNSEASRSNAALWGGRLIVGALIALVVWSAEHAVLGSPATATASQHWAFQPPAEVTPPRTKRTRWIQSPVDAFILARLEAAHLTPAPAAEKATLLRRVTFDLIGLPPAPAEIDAFLADQTDDALPRVVDRLLASPHYGERWGRHWLDVARYADSNGQDENKAMAHAWRYRDYVIQAFNQDMPFDQFIREQLAGDLLPDPHDERSSLERLTATGFLVLGPKMLAEQDKPKLVMDVVDEQIDVVSRAFLGLTISCSRCHDHKTDPIATRDYYALAGIFKSTKTMGDLAFVSKWNERPVATRQERARHEAHVKRTNEVARQLTSVTREAEEAVRAQWRAQAGDYFASALAASSDESTSTSASATNLSAPSHPSLHRPTLDRWLAHLTHARTNADASALAPFLPSERTYPPSALSNALDRFTQAVARIEREPAPSSPRAPRFLPGRLGPGLRCGGDNYLEHPHAGELEPAHLTVEGWVRIESSPPEGDRRRWLVNKNPNEWVDGHYALMLDNRRPGAYLNIGGGPTNLIAVWSDGPPLALHEWRHLAFTYDGAALRLFVDGQPAGVTSVHRPRTPGTGPLHLGRRQDGYNYFSGGLDEVALYGRALSPAELLARARQPDGALPAGQVRHWSFDPVTKVERDQWANAGLRELLYGPGGLLLPPAETQAYFPPALAAQRVALEAELSALRTNAPPEPAVALAVEEGTPANIPVHLRGSHLSLGKDLVPRGFVPVLDRARNSSGLGPPRAPKIPDGHSGRLELAQWLTHPDQPLTARVTVNRIWQAHFGEGLVRSPDNFGVTGERPSHPELLDWLAREFIRGGWSVKRLHRLVVLSSTYQMSTAFNERSARIDPENRLLWRMNRRRLEAEPLRDALLAVAERLDRSSGGSLVDWRNADYTPDESVSARSRRRAVYLPIVRDRVYDMFTIFDFANPSVGVSRRTPTVVSHQALFFLNSPFVKEQARALAEGLLTSPAADDTTRLQAVYRRVLGRPATHAEIQRATNFLETQSRGTPAIEAWTTFSQTLLAANEFLYVD